MEMVFKRHFRRSTIIFLLLFLAEFYGFKKMHESLLTWAWPVMLICNNGNGPNAKCLMD